MAIWGAHDRLFPATMAAQFAEAVPNGRTRLISDCGHMLPFENPQALLDAVRELDKEGA
jgi:pimeloyl-ACP methyl ester carboxylesterase